MLGFTIQLIIDLIVWGEGEKGSDILFGALEPAVMIFPLQLCCAENEGACGVFRQVPS